MDFVKLQKKVNEKIKQIRSGDTVSKIIGILLAIYFFPTICAKGNDNEDKIFAVNLFLGWFPVVWIILLLAALIGDRKK